MIFDLGLINGKIYMQGDWYEGNLYIKDGIIAAMSTRKLGCKVEYDANENMILPGFIDPHVHFDLDLGELSSVDDFESGSRAAAFGGITTVIDFLRPVKTREDLRNAFAKRLTQAQNSCVDYSFHSTICGMDDNLEEFVDDSRLLGIPTIKMFTTYASSDRKTKDSIIYELIEMSRSKNILPMIHAENDDFIQENEVMIADHEKSRPTISEVTEVLKLAEFVEYTGGRAYIVHVSSGLTVQKVKKKYRDIINKNLIIESCPHYFHFNSDVYKGKAGSLYTMAPPLRSEDEQILLINSYENIDTIGTDHCSFNKKHKDGKYTQEIPMGIGGVETSFVSMFSLYGESVIEKFTTRPAKVHGLYPVKGTLNIGAQADVVIFNPKGRSTIKTHYKNDYDLYGDIVMKGEIVSTLLRGRFLIKDSVFMGGKGSYIGRELI